jgi:hypothetical protein
MSDLALTLARHPRFCVGVTDPLGRGLLWVPSEDGALVPDLTDAATAGVLLAMLMEADPTASVTIDLRDDPQVMVCASPPDGRCARIGGDRSLLGVYLAQALLAVWGPA